jgi:hypothetical protein
MKNTPPFPHPCSSVGPPRYPWDSPLLQPCFALLFLLTSSAFAFDYCDYLSRDIQGRQHSFIAGNHMYYIGGRSSTEWKTTEHETIGFTHPLFRDGRARGYGIADGPGGTGHDKFGWEFWNHIRAAYGSVIIGDKTHNNPRPREMIWRPDRVICRYHIDGVDIEETKFIARNDVLCSIIRASTPIRIRFDGRSFENKNAFPTFDGDAPNQRFVQSLNPSARHDADANLLHIVERGSTLTKLDWKKPPVHGRIMYDGMSTILSASVPLESVAIRRADNGVQHYSFDIAVGSDPVALTYAMGDDPAETQARSLAIRNSADSALTAKTAWFNDLLSSQIPYFRCSDDSVVKTYYYLWSLYFMYFTHADKGYENYPHTQTAINNFMGLHLWDSWAYTAMGSWVVDRPAWGHGNILSWKHFIDQKDKFNAIPDNFGTTWFSPGVWMNLVGAIEPAWEMYQRSGDKAYLHSVYNELFRPLYWNDRGPQDSFGLELNALTILGQMATALGQPQDLAFWEAKRPNFLKRFRKPWGGLAKNYYALASEPWMDIWQLSSLLCHDMPQEWADLMTRDWIMNSETGYLGPVSLRIRPPQYPPNGVFRVSSMSTWLAIEGMFRRGQDYDAVFLTQNHIRGMTKDHGYPVAPECWDPDDKPWGSMYYNWDSAMTDLLLKRIAGIDYSVVDGTFTVNERTPEDWTFVETRIPVDGKWVRTRLDQKHENGQLHKTLTVENCPLTLKTKLWSAGRKVLAETATRITLGAPQAPRQTLAVVTPSQRTFIDPITVRIENLQPGTTLRLNGQPAPETLTISETTTLQLQADDHAPMPVVFTRAVFKPASQRDTQPGLAFTRYDGPFKALRKPNSKHLPAANGVTETLDPSRITDRKDDFALVLTGYIKVPEDGLYEFTLKTDDGSRLTVAGEQVIDMNILCHLDPWTATGSIALQAGLHPIQIDYFQANNHRRLDLSYRLNGGPQVPVTGDMLRR